jgi:sulfite reductase (NADPH) flavoprotein alpha-component
MGPAWLFFGHQRSAHDFFYADEWETLRQRGRLTNLSLAWSRDGAQKSYVQDKMREAGRELWSWLQRGAHLYVCGDAKRMARDVEAAVRDIAAAEGGLSAEAAAAFVAKLKADSRYQQDVY